ncbi:MAG: hypothetical protein DDT21_01422 [Syntrophomonadaceae bacterium]|nr:hypothetical protein [Bacillota bacterium]
METTVSYEKQASKEKWLVIRYRPTSLFSLRMTHATSKGGKTLLVPTPYAVKLAFIDACFRKFSADEALSTSKKVFNLLKGSQVRFRPPDRCVIQNTFLKVKQEERDAPAGIYAPTIAYREFCYFDGDLEVALAVSGLTSHEVDELSNLAPYINYLGKRGSFMQYLSLDILPGPLPAGFSCPETASAMAQGNYATTNYLDDFGEALVKDKHGFERINTYGTKPSALGEYRVLIRTLLPYRYVASGRHFTYYVRTID